MRKFFWLFLVNILVVLTLSILAAVFGVNQYLTSTGIDIPILLAFCLLWGFSGAFISLLLSKTMAIRLMGVRLITDSNSQLMYLKAMVHDLAKKAGMTAMPEVGVYDSPEVNAFATGPSEKRSLVAVSSGLLNKMTRDELEGVLAHEVAHIKNGDMVIMTLIQGCVNAFVMFLSRILAMVINNMIRGNSSSDNRGSGMYYMIVFALEMVLSFLGFMVVCYFSRRREFRADAGGAKYAGSHKMVGALESLQRTFNKNLIVQDKVSTMKIAGNSWKLLFSTHPPLEERIKTLEKNKM